MSHVVLIDLDECASMIRETLDLALPHIKTSANPQAALKAVTAQWAYSDLILRNLDPKYTLEVERFETLRREARHMIASFWENYRLFPIELSNGKVAQAQVVEPSVPPKHAIKHVGGDKLKSGKGSRTLKDGRKPRVFLSDREKNEIWQYIQDHGPRLTKEDYVALMELYNVSEGGINHIRYDWTPMA